MSALQNCAISLKQGIEKLQNKCNAIINKPMTEKEFENRDDAFCTANLFHTYLNWLPYMQVISIDRNAVTFLNNDTMEMETYKTQWCND